MGRYSGKAALSGPQVESGGLRVGGEVQQEGGSEQSSHRSRSPGQGMGLHGGAGLFWGAPGSGHTGLLG